MKAIASRHGIHPSQVKEWRRRFEEGGREALRSGSKQDTDQAAVIKELHTRWPPPCGLKASGRAATEYAG